MFSRNLSEKKKNVGKTVFFFFSRMRKDETNRRREDMERERKAMKDVR
jgi:hypothetical protein